jgi:hypothetical protein
MFLGTENLATAALRFVDCESTEDHYTQGHALMLGAADFNVKTHPGLHFTSSGCGVGRRRMY